MPLLIDGYNLLHVTGIVGSGGLQGSREGLLRFLAATIDPRERPQTTIVFDAAEAPPGLPRTIVYEEMTVHFSSDYDNADEMIEELIAANNVPRSLLVVSSDHRLQRAARRRRAPFVDSDVWFAEALRRRERNRRPTPKAAKPLGSLTSEEINYWLAEFGDMPEVEEPAPPRRKTKQAPATSGEPPKPVKGGPKKKKQADEGGDLSNPFPPGYGEDLLGRE